MKVIPLNLYSYKILGDIIFITNDTCIIGQILNTKHESDTCIERRIGNFHLKVLLA